MLQSIFSQFSCFGFSGSRQWSGSFAPLTAAADSVPVGGRVLVGCAPGVDAFFRSRFPSAEVFSVRSGRWGRGRGAFAALSIACVSGVVGGVGGGLWVSFPSSACPAGLFPSGSGTWASLAFAIGSGLPCLVFLGSIKSPSGWGLSPVPGSPGWFGCSSVLGFAPVQLSLF